MKKSLHKSLLLVFVLIAFSACSKDYNIPQIPDTHPQVQSLLDTSTKKAKKEYDEKYGYLERDGFKFAPHDSALTQYLSKNPQKNRKIYTKAKPTLLTSPTSTQPLMQLPPDFNLGAWEQRLLQIINTTRRDSAFQSQGICGVCMLQAYQIVAEFIHYHNSPLTNGGYFFDTAPNTNPFTSFQQRHSILHDTLADIEDYYAIPTTAASSVFLNSMNTAIASSISMLPQYDWSLFGVSANTQGITDLIDRLFRDSRRGDMYLAFLLLFLPERETIMGHTVVILRTNEGIVMIPTNIRALSLDALRRYMQVATNTAELRARLTARARGRTSILAGLGLIEVREAPNLPFVSALSFSDCVGEGDDRRGNNALPSAATLNQCASGRCNQ